MYDYLIVGSGLFGATFAHEAALRGETCLVIDKRPHLGGNIYCERVEGINVHKYGAHIFHTNSKEVWDYVNRLVPFNRYTRDGKCHQPDRHHPCSSRLAGPRQLHLLQTIKDILMFRIMRKSMLRKLATALTSNVLVFRNGSFNEDYSYRKESNKMTPDFIGTWTCSFDEGGLATLIFNHGGTVIYQEYDSERRKKTEEAMNYTYNEGILSFYPKGKSNPETAKVVSLTSSKLILQDWPEESGNCTFYKQ